MSTIRKTPPREEDVKRRIAIAVSTIVVIVSIAATTVAAAIWTVTAVVAVSATLVTVSN